MHLNLKKNSYDIFIKQHMGFQTSVNTVNAVERWHPSKLEYVEAGFVPVSIRSSVYKLPVDDGVI